MSVVIDGVAPSDLRFELRPGPGAPRAARRRVLAAVAPVDGVDLDVLALLTSELVTNVVLHADTPARVHLTVDERAVRVAVSDDDPSQPEMKSVSESSVTGRGLHIVDALADRWGVSREDSDSAKTVWFELNRSSGSGDHR